MITRRRFIRNAAIGAGALWLPETGPRFAGAAILPSGGGTQENGTAGGATEASQSLAFPGTVTTGDFIVVAGNLYSSYSTTVGVTTNRSAPLTVIDANNGVGQFLVFYIAYGFATSSGSCTVTVTPSASSFLSFGINAYTDVRTTTPLDVNAGLASAAGGGNTFASNDVNTTVDNALVIGIVSSNTAASPTITPDAAYNRRSSRARTTSRQTRSPCLL